MFRGVGDRPSGPEPRPATTTGVMTPPLELGGHRATGDPRVPCSMAKIGVLTLARGRRTAGFATDSRRCPSASDWSLVYGMDTRRHQWRVVIIMIEEVWQR